MLRHRVSRLKRGQTVDVRFYGFFSRVPQAKIHLKLSDGYAMCCLEIQQVIHNKKRGNKRKVIKNSTNELPHYINKSELNNYKKIHVYITSIKRKKKKRERKKTSSALLPHFYIVAKDIYNQ